MKTYCIILCKTLSHTIFFCSIFSCIPIFSRIIKNNWLKAVDYFCEKARS